jgi:hypothetical protein
MRWEVSKGEIVDLPTVSRWFCLSRQDCRDEFCTQLAHYACSCFAVELGMRSFTPYKRVYRDEPGATNVSFRMRFLRPILANPQGTESVC